MSIWLETAQRATPWGGPTSGALAILLRLRERLRFSEETLHLLLAGVVGVIGGFTNVLFHAATGWAQLLTLRHTGDLVGVAYSLGNWERLLIPLLGTVAGLDPALGTSAGGPQGSSNLLEVVVAGDGKLPMRTALVKASSSLASIATGASIDAKDQSRSLRRRSRRKGGQLARWHPYRMRLLVACGAASEWPRRTTHRLVGAISRRKSSWAISR